jgi:hypothetical protein
MMGAAPHFDLQQITREKRLVTADYHVIVGRSWRLIGEPELFHSPLAYSAFEFRCAIERFLFELLWLIRSMKLSAADRRAAGRLANLVKTILQIEGGEHLLKQKLIFARIAASEIGVPQREWPAVVDVKELERFWNKLSTYCHRQLKPGESWESRGEAWLRQGYILVRDVENYLWDAMVKSRIGWVPVGSLPPEMVQARDDFISGRIDEPTLRTRMRLMAPVLTQRKLLTLV